MNKAKSVLYLLLLMTFAVWAIWQVVRPMIPYLLVAAAAAWLFGLLVYRRR